MNFFMLMSGVNIALAAYMIFSCAKKLQDIDGHALEQIVSAPIFIALALIVLHSVGLANSKELTASDLSDAAWRVVDMVTLITMIRLIKVIKE
jgi:hypothetical protein